MPRMAVDGDQARLTIDPGRAGQLCRELQLAGVDVLLSGCPDGVISSGAALSVVAPAILRSASAAAQLQQQAFDVLAGGLPLSVSVRQLTASGDAELVLFRLCELLGRAANDAGVQPSAIELAIGAESLSPQAAWLARQRQLGDGPLYLFPTHAMMRPDETPVQRNRHERFWLQLWHARTVGMVQAAYAPLVSPNCPLLSVEAAHCIVPSIAIQAPAGSAWLPMLINISGFADQGGTLREGELEDALRRAVAIGDELHNLTNWPTAQMRHDAWLNRRLAIFLTGFGDLTQRRNLDPSRFSTLERLCELLRWAKDILHTQSQRLASQSGCMPALELGDPSRMLPGGHARDGWRDRWREAVESASIRHRNLLVLSPWSVFPAAEPADYRYADLLPLLGYSNTCAFAGRPDLSQWNINKFKNFHQRAWAVLQQRDVAQQIAERL